MAEEKLRGRSPGFRSVRTDPESSAWSNAALVEDKRFVASTCRTGRRERPLSLLVGSLDAREPIWADQASVLRKSGVTDLAAMNRASEHSVPSFPLCGTCRVYGRGAHYAPLWLLAAGRNRQPGAVVGRRSANPGLDCGCGGGLRTPNLPVNSRTLYQFNYPTVPTSLRQVRFGGSADS